MWSHEVPVWQLRSEGGVRSLYDWQSTVHHEFSSEGGVVLIHLQEACTWSILKCSHTKRGQCYKNISACRLVCTCTYALAWAATHRTCYWAASSPNLLFPVLHGAIFTSFCHLKIPVEVQVALKTVFYIYMVASINVLNNWINSGRSKDMLWDSVLKAAVCKGFLLLLAEYGCSPKNF